MNITVSSLTLSSFAHSPIISNRYNYFLSYKNTIYKAFAPFYNSQSQKQVFKYNNFHKLLSSAITINKQTFNGEQKRFIYIDFFEPTIIQGRLFNGVSSEDIGASIITIDSASSTLEVTDSNFIRCTTMYSEGTILLKESGSSNIANTCFVDCISKLRHHLLSAIFSSSNKVQLSIDSVTAFHCGIKDVDFLLYVANGNFNLNKFNCSQSTTLGAAIALEKVKSFSSIYLNFGSNQLDSILSRSSLNSDLFDQICIFDNTMKCFLKGSFWADINRLRYAGNHADSFVDLQIGSNLYIHNSEFDATIFSLIPNTEPDSIRFINCKENQDNLKAFMDTSNQSLCN